MGYGIQTQPYTRKGFWHLNKPDLYHLFTEEGKRIWDEFVQSTHPPDEDLKIHGGTGAGYINPDHLATRFDK